MGLDMYFEARKSKYKGFSHWDKDNGVVDETNYPEDLKVLAEYIENRNFKSATIEESFQIGYFRKFNALHNFIVENYADGIDEYQPIRLDKVNLEKMLEICKAVREDKSKADELLPTRSGCFFGSLEYDEWYFNDVDEAIKMFELILNNLDFETYDVIYQASW